jgi:hypothetical protein
MLLRLRRQGATENTTARATAMEMGKTFLVMVLVVVEPTITLRK